MEYTQEQLSQMTPEQFAEVMSQMRATHQQQQQGLSQQPPVQGPGTSGGAGNMMYMPRGYLQQPPSLSDVTNYDVWVKKLTLWERGCGLDKSMMATLLINSMGNNCPLKKGLAEKFFQKHQAEEMEGDNALELVKNF